MRERRWRDGRVPSGRVFERTNLSSAAATSGCNSIEGAALKATDEPAHFDAPKEEKGLVAFVNGKNLTNITIAGQGIYRRFGRALVATGQKKPKKAGQPRASPPPANGRSVKMQKRSHPKRDCSKILPASIWSPPTARTS